MSLPEDIDSKLNELLPDAEDDETGDMKLRGTFQLLSSLGGHLGLYEDLTNPSKQELVTALYEQGVRNANEESVYDFLRVDDDSTTGYLRSKNGTWIEHDIDDMPDWELFGEYGDLAKTASFLGLYERYGLEAPSANKLRHGLLIYGVRDGPEDGPRYLAPLEDEQGAEHLIGIGIGEVTTGYPVDSAGYRVGDNEYTRDLLPKLAARLAADTPEESGSTPEPFAPKLPDEVSNLLDNEVVAENYQLIMHRLAEQATGPDVSAVARSRKLAEARFVTEVLTGERTWE